MKFSFLICILINSGFDNRSAKILSSHTPEEKAFVLFQDSLINFFEPSKLFYFKGVTEKEVSIVSLKKDIKLIKKSDSLFFMNAVFCEEVSREKVKLRTDTFRSKRIKKKKRRKFNDLSIYRNCEIKQGIFFVKLNVTDGESGMIFYVFFRDLQYKVFKMSYIF